MSKTSETLLAALHKAEHRREPFDYWLLEDLLPEAVCDGIAKLPFTPAEDSIFDGRRKSNNSKRVYFTPANQQRFAVCREVADAFYSSRVVHALERTTGAALTTARLRIEYCQDVDGFWLEPQVGIPVKLLTMRLYLMDAPELHEAGTDLYDSSPEHKLVASVPYEWKHGAHLHSRQ